MSEVLVGQRWLPQTLWSVRWFRVEDAKAIDTGNWVFDQRGCYAGLVTGRRDWGLRVHWYKTDGNEFDSWEVYSRMADYLWVDPARQKELLDQIDQIDQIQ